MTARERERELNVGMGVDSKIEVEGEQKDKEPEMVIAEMATENRVDWTLSEIARAREILQAGKELYGQWAGDWSQFRAINPRGSLTARVGEDMLRLSAIMTGDYGQSRELEISSLPTGDQRSIRVFENGFCAIRVKKGDGRTYGYAADEADIQSAAKYHTTLLPASTTKLPF